MVRGYNIVDSKLVQIVEEDLYKCPVMVFVSPDAEERRDMIDILNVNEHTLHSALDPDEVSRLELEPEHIAMILKRPKNYSTEEHYLFKVGSVGIFLFKEKIAFVIDQDFPMFEGKPFSKITSLTELVLKTCYSSIFHFFEHLRVISMISDELEQKVQASMENKYLINMFTLEKSLVYYLNAITSNGTLIEKLRQNKSRIGFNMEEAEFLDDITIENTQCFKQAEIYSNILASLMNARVSVVSNNLNILMKTLTLITIGIQAPTFIVSLFSMNVDIPFSGHPFAFWIVCGLSTASVLLLLTVWKVKKL